MLAEECPNSTCFGVPLVRPPKVGGGKDSRKECVICHGVYVSEKGASGYENLVALGQIINELPQTAAAKAPGSSGSARNGKSVIRDPSSLTLDSAIPVSNHHHTTPEQPSLAPNLISDNTFCSTQSTGVLDASAHSLEISLGALSEKNDLLVHQTAAVGSRSNSNDCGCYQQGRASSRSDQTITME